MRSPIKQDGAPKLICQGRTPIYYAVEDPEISYNAVRFLELPITLCEVTINFIGIHNKVSMIFSIEF